MSDAHENQSSGKEELLTDMTHILNHDSRFEAALAVEFKYGSEGDEMLTDDEIDFIMAAIREKVRRRTPTPIDEKGIEQLQRALARELVMSLMDMEGTDADDIRDAELFTENKLAKFVIALRSISTPDVSGVERENERLRDAILWALGENGEFRGRFGGEGAYWWRTELRARAALAEKGGKL